VRLERRRGPQQVRVALVRPPVVVFPKSLSGHGPIPPIGLAYLAGALRDDGHDVQVVDGPGTGIDQHVERRTAVGDLLQIGLTPGEIVDAIHPETTLVGVSNMFLHEWPATAEVIEAVRRRLPGATIVAGGDNATAFWPWMFEQSSALDHVVLGEGELTLRELVRRHAAGEPVLGLPAVVSREDPEGTAPELPVRIRAVDDLPRPAWDLFPLDAYWRHADYFGVERGRSMPVLATRGCPYRCSFCSSPQMWTTRYVVRDPDDLADEIAALVQDHAVENIDFADLTAITKRQWTLQFCDALEARGLDITWQLPVGTRAEALDAVVLQRLYDTGCRNVTYAPESGSTRMLEVFDKRADLDHILTSLRAAHGVGLRTHVNVIIGHPAERWLDRWQTLVYLARCALVGADTAAAIMFCAYPGSKDFEALLAAGVVEVDEDFLYLALSRGSGHHQSVHPHLSARRLRAVQLAMMAIFYGLTLLRHPRRIAARLRAQRSGSEETHLDQFVRIKRRGFRAARTA
jgi:radical SAM superfamily enzyme YgiQ (UPF0313 family)